LLLKHCQKLTQILVASHRFVLRMDFAAR
jgi:hypothetical protein